LLLLYNLKILGPSSAPDGTVSFIRKKMKFMFRKQSEKSSSGTKLAEKGRKKVI